MRIPTTATIEEYLALYPRATQKIVKQVLAVIRKAAPRAEESINYGIPTFNYLGNLVHVGAYKHHIGFYPAPSGIQNFKKELARYKTSKGAVQFPIDEPLPLKLIAAIVKFRVMENEAKAEMKKKK
jgi:uncharacterized protein YdhG (YjbR/CyaY superfamily)